MEDNSMGDLQQKLGFLSTNQDQEAVEVSAGARDDPETADIKITTLDEILGRILCQPIQHFLCIFCSDDRPGYIVEFPEIEHEEDLISGIRAAHHQPSLNRQVLHSHLAF